LPAEVGSKALCKALDIITARVERRPCPGLLSPRTLEERRDVPESFESDPTRLALANPRMDGVG
jgi:hypothetical protein